MAPKKETSSAAPAKKGGKKDPNAPKRPLSAYMFFSRDAREQTKTDNPQASFGEIGRLLGASWKALSDAEKKPYIDMAERDKVRAESEKSAYAKSGGGGEKKAGKKGKAAPVEEEEEESD